jgi:hypothetical protein
MHDEESLALFSGAGTVWRGGQHERGRGGRNQARSRAHTHTHIPCSYYTHAYAQRITHRARNASPARAVEVTDATSRHLKNGLVQSLMYTLYYFIKFI